MKRTFVFACGVWFVWSADTGAHRLDEYLQATQISVDGKVIHLSIALTPGVEVADRVVGLIDRDGDDVLSVEEQMRYAGLVLSAMALEIDGRRTPVTLVDRRFPSVDDMRAGSGTVRLRARATTPRLVSGSHELRFFNLHQPEIGAYLVNALMPPAGIEITAQQRDPWQREFTLAFSSSPAFDARRALVLFATGLLAVALLARRPAWLRLESTSRSSSPGGTDCPRRSDVRA